MGHNQRCIQQAMAFDTNIRAVTRRFGRASFLDTIGRT